MAFCLTGVTTTLVAGDSTTKFSATEGWAITALSGLGRSVVVIDDSDLSIAEGMPMQYCFGSLHSLRPLTVNVKLDPDNTTVFPDASTEDGSVPVPLGTVTAAANHFVLTLPEASGNPTKLTFSGAIIDDAGLNLVNNDRLRTTFQIQPDGKSFSWEGTA